jgi:hypothetical protein
MYLSVLSLLLGGKESLSALKYCNFGFYNSTILQTHYYNTFLNMDRKKYLMQIINSCPMGNASCECVINKYRKVSILKLIKVMDGITDKEVLKITQQHVKCLRKRKQKIKENTRFLYETRA